MSEWDEFVKDMTERIVNLAKDFESEVYTIKVDDVVILNKINKMVENWRKGFEVFGTDVDDPFSVLYFGLRDRMIFEHRSRELFMEVDRVKNEACKRIESIARKYFNYDNISTRSLVWVYDNICVKIHEKVSVCFMLTVNVNMVGKEIIIKPRFWSIGCHKSIPWEVVNEIYNNVMRMLGREEYIH